jgi:hypothetical protein
VLLSLPLVFAIHSETQIQPRESGLKKSDLSDLQGNEWNKRLLKENTLNVYKNKRSH